jgi:AraC-like DNA-binding protein
VKPQPINTTFTRFLVSLKNDPLRKWKIQTFVSELSQSPKSFIASFKHKQVYGMPPKKFMHLVQLNLALKQIAFQLHLALTQVAFQTGYYEQSHFIRVFREHTHLSPKEYRKLVVAGRTSAYSPNYLRLR